MTTKQRFMILGAVIVIALTASLVATGASPPKYGAMPFEVGIVSSTVDQDILGAPGSNMRWVVTGLGYNILVEAADTKFTVKDKAGTAVDIAEISSESQGFGVYYDYGAGIVCSINSGVTVDFSASTADVYIYVTAYKERAEG